MLWDNFAFELCPSSSATCGPCGVLSGWGDLGFVSDISPSLFGVYMWEGHRGHGARISSTAPSSTPAGGHPASLTPTPGSGSALPPRWPQPVLLQGACCRGLAVSPLLSPGHLEGGREGGGAVGGVVQRVPSWPPEDRVCLPLCHQAWAGPSPFAGFGVPAAK